MRHKSTDSLEEYDGWASEEDDEYFEDHSDEFIYDFEDDEFENETSTKSEEGEETEE